MLTLGIEYLTGYAVATDAADREQAEWPPHPARVFMAMAAAHFETAGQAAEREALLWLERLAPPMIHASDFDRRELVTHYVPVNDALDEGGGPPPYLRKRQGRVYPRVRPIDPRVYLYWPDVQCPPPMLAAIDSLCSKVTRIGHSSSLVRMWATDAEPPTPETHDLWRPDDERPENRLRTITDGSLEELERRFRAADLAEYDRLTGLIDNGTPKEKKQAKALRAERFDDLPPQPIRPDFRLMRGYQRQPVGPAPDQAVWDDRLLVFGLQPMETSHTRLDIVATLAVTGALRDAAIKVEERNTPEALSGHRPDGSPSETPHAAFLPLPFVGREHADGHLMGVAVALPKALSTRERQHIARILGRIEYLTLGKLGKWKLMGRDELPDAYNLRSSTWCAGGRGATCWATVTPISFDAHPKSNDRQAYGEQVTAMIRQACRRIELPEPAEIHTSHVSAVEGVPTAREFPRLARKDGSLRRQCHAVICFDQSVRGPILLGAGRYRGYGLLRPVQGGPHA